MASARAQAGAGNCSSARDQVASAAFSPDGSRIAFAGKGDAASETTGFDLYVRALGSETLLRLTRHPSEAISPAWSPDGTQIAFYRLAGADTGIYVVPALGGPERKLRSTRLPSRAFSPVRLIPVIRWSPDGKWIALADELPEEAFNGITFLSTETWETNPAGRTIPESCEPFLRCRSTGPIDLICSLLRSQEAHKPVIGKPLTPS